MQAATRKEAAKGGKSEYFKRFQQITQGDSGGALTVDGVLAGLVSRGGSDICAKVT